ncbi:MAG: hypothetical protein ABR582_14925 [Gemmatimonadaceae bacterium]
MAKSFAERGVFPRDVYVSPTVVGQSVIALPVIRAFGFSHVHLRILTLLVSAGILLELECLLTLAGVTARIRFVALAMLVANPIFLNLAMSFMTEVYGYFVALLSACIWYAGRKRESGTFIVLAGVMAGLSFWIRQFGALVLPALVLGEWLAGPRSLTSARTIALRRAPAVLAWWAMIALYFAWSKATGNSPYVAGLVANVWRVHVGWMLLEAGLWLFYLTIFFAPLIIGQGISSKLTVGSGLFFGALALTAMLAWVLGTRNGPPSVFLNSTFPFLNNVFTRFGVGPVTITDVYWGNAPSRPRVPVIPWLVLEMFALIVSLGWSKVVGRMRVATSEIGFFGICLSVLTLVAVLLPFRENVLDRYHYPSILGFCIALAVVFPPSNWRRLRYIAAVWILMMAAFSTLGMHDYFRWQEVRASLLSEAARRGIRVSEVEAGVEQNGWSMVEGIDHVPGCAPSQILCGRDRYRIGVQAFPTENVILSRPVKTWLVRFPNLELIQKL